MAEVVNLRRARKAKTRQNAATEAEQNRAVHGRTMSERVQQKDDKTRAARHLDNHRLSDEQTPLPQKP